MNRGNGNHYSVLCMCLCYYCSSLDKDDPIPLKETKAQ